MGSARLKLADRSVRASEPWARHGVTIRIMGRSVPQVAVIYHFFAHYRRAVVERLAKDTHHAWCFVGDDRDFGSDIKPADLDPSVRRIRTRCTRLIGPTMWQHGILWTVLSPRWATVIFLGNPYYLATWPAAILARLTGKRVLFWTHGWTSPPRGARRWIRRIFYRLAHGLLIYGRFAKTVAIAEGFPPERVHVVGNSLDVPAQRASLARIPADRPAAVRRELFGDERTPVISCTTRLTPQRRLDMLLDAASLLRARGRPVNIVLVGDGPERAALERQSAELRLKVRFLGACYDEDRIGEILLASNACVAPGQVGLTAMHALAFGVPVISHGDPWRQMPEFESIVPGKTGSLFTEGDVKSLADAMEPWIRSSTISESTRADCREMIDRFWSPAFQAEVIMRAVDGEPADDLFWLRSKHSERCEDD